MTTDVATRTASELAAMTRAKQISSRELLEVFLGRVEALNPPLNAVVTLDAEAARAAAARADDAATRGGDLPPLHGLPITIKDAIETGGTRSTGGATELRDHVPSADAPAVAKLKGAGAIVFGKTNAPRWSGDVQTYNDMFGTTNNPWDLSRTPGGSSGGAACAVAAGLTSFELGTDIGGSVRVPSHFCGVFGLKPSYGVVPQRGYLDHVGGGTTDADINVFGPIARHAEDLDLLLGVLAGPEPERALAWRLELPPPAHDTITAYRIAVWFDESACPLDREYAAVLGAAVDALVDAGAKVEEARPPVEFAEQVNLFNSMVAAAISPSMSREDGDALGSHHQWLRQAKQRARLQSTWADWFGRYDVLLCPVSPTAAFPHDHTGGWFDRTIEVSGQRVPYFRNIAWTGLIGIVGLPAAVPPLGRSSSGLPVGVQVVTPYLRDRDAVRVARLITDVVGGYEPPPLA